MASKWKYATLSADERLELLRQGRKDVFDEEIARTREVVKARKELGLDTDEQERWVDTIGYNYNLSNAEKIGESPDNVAKTGYAGLYLGDDKKTGGTSQGVSMATTGVVEPSVKGRTTVGEFKTSARPTSTLITGAKRKIERAGELAIEAIEKRYADKRIELEEAFYGDNPYIREAVLNSGGHDEGGKMARAYRELAETLGVTLSGVNEDMEREIAQSRRKYANLVDKLLDYRKNGAEKESLDTIADVLIKNAAVEDGYDHSLVTGKGKKRKSDDTALEGEEESKATEKSGMADAFKLTPQGKTTPADLAGNSEALTSESTFENGTSSDENNEDADGAEAVTEEETGSDNSRIKALTTVIQLAKSGKVKRATELLSKLSGLDSEKAKRILTLILGKARD